MNRDEKMIGGRRTALFDGVDAEWLLIQPVDEHDAALLENETVYIEAHTKKKFALAAFEVKNWNAELSPWEAPPVFGNEPFGDDAAETLRFVTDTLLPALRERFGRSIRCGIGGYSLAGLFALWTGYQTDLFPGVAAASPSVWFPGWANYAAQNRPLAKRVYLSLGDKEEKARNPVMATVGDHIRRQYAQMKEAGIDCTLEWNEGNHFRDSDIRTAKGFIWLMAI